MLSSSSPHQRFFHSSSSSSSTTNNSSLPNTSLPDNSIFYCYPDSSSTSSGATSNSYHASAGSIYSPSKRLKLENFDYSDVPSTYDCPPLIFPTAMPQAVHRPLINLHRASEPASPVTIATTLSNHSTPAPSPSRVTIVSDSSPADFSLYDHEYAGQDNQQKQHNSQPRYSSTSGQRFPYNLDHTWPEYPMGYPVHEQQNHFSPMPVYPTNNHPSYSQGQEDDAVPALSPSHCNTSRPSVSEIDMPATPIPSPVNGDGRRCVQAPATREDSYIQNWITSCLPFGSEAVPKLARTISDAEQDELFNPGIAPGTAHAHPEQQVNNSQLPTLFRQAQTQHAMARPAQQSLMMRDHSPFRANSPLHPARTQQEIAHAPARTSAFLGVGAYESARSRREREMEREVEALKEQMNKEYEEMQQTPKTISPKDACIEYHEIEGEGIQGSLFSSSQNDESYSQSSALDVKSESDNDSYHGSVHDDESLDNGYDSMATSRRESDVNMSDYNMQIYNNAQYGDHLQIPTYGWVDDGSGQESETSRLSDESYQYAPVHHRPEDTRANDGAYSCTVPGCTMRFSTASKMSKHRREVHRHNTPMGRDAPGKSLLQGPSRCARINPTTGKPCNTVFSRPYDLTRHEDTIHNTARQKVRCEICNDEKTFSRQDALTRHKKVKHGIDK